MEPQLVMTSSPMCSDISKKLLQFGKEIKSYGAKSSLYGECSKTVKAWRHSSVIAVAFVWRRTCHVQGEPAPSDDEIFEVVQSAFHNAAYS